MVQASQYCRIILRWPNQWTSRSSSSMNTLAPIQRWNGLTGKTRTENRWSVKVITGLKQLCQAPTSGIVLKQIRLTHNMSCNGNQNQTSFIKSACLSTSIHLIHPRTDPINTINKIWWIINRLSIAPAPSLHCFSEYLIFHQTPHHKKVPGRAGSA